jgi:cell division septal protein FtsQ
MRKRGSLRSSRGGFFSEPERRSPEKRRSQRVRFRRAYASSVMKRTWGNFLKVAGGSVVIGGLIYGGVSAWRFWEGSTTLRVAAVTFDGDIPPTLTAQFPVKTGTHLFNVKSKKIEEALLAKFPELETLDISRGLDRTLVVTGRYKKAEALYESDGKTMGVMSDGTLFPLAAHNPQAENLVVLAGKTGPAARLQQLKALSAWKNDVPEFSALVKRIETDNIGAVRVVLEGGIVVQWGEMNENEFVVHAGNILNVLDRFTPARTPASLRVISTNRIVMDPNWKQK